MCELKQYIGKQWTKPIGPAIGPATVLELTITSWSSIRPLDDIGNREYPTRGSEKFLIPADHFLDVYLEDAINKILQSDSRVDHVDDFLKD